MRGRADAAARRAAGAGEPGDGPGATFRPAEHRSRGLYFGIARASSRLYKQELRK